MRTFFSLTSQQTYSKVFSTAIRAIHPEGAHRMTDFSRNELNAAEDPAPDPTGAAPPPLPMQLGLRPTFLEQFLMGNYFYVFSAVAFMLGCYLLMTAPFITGTVFMR